MSLKAGVVVLVLIVGAFLLGYAFNFDAPPLENERHALEDAVPEESTEYAPLLQEHARTIEGAMEGEDGVQADLEEWEPPVDVFTLEPGQLIDIEQLQPNQRKEVRRYMTLQGTVSGFDMDRALLVRGDGRGVGAVVLRDAVTRRQLDPADYDSRLLAELSEAQADVHYYKHERYLRSLDEAHQVYDTLEQARAAKKQDPRYKNFSLRRSHGRYVVADLRPTHPDPDVSRCEAEIRELEERLGVRSEMSWYGMPSDQE